MGVWGQSCARRSWQQAGKDRSGHRTDGQGLGLGFLRKVLRHGDICLAKLRAGELQGERDHGAASPENRPPDWLCLGKALIKAGGGRK